MVSDRDGRSLAGLLAAGRERLCKRPCGELQEGRVGGMGRAARGAGRARESCRSALGVHTSESV